MTPALLELSAVTLDCADPLELAAFYQQALGVAPHARSDADFAGLTLANGLFIGFQRVDGHQPPSWPGQGVPQQLHLDFDVDDLEQARDALVALGASEPAHQPTPDKWLVLLDPAGHPFCLSPRNRT
ncbi:VOC family protein [Streptomyces sp. NPDC001941]|uniref:VOC family protein n=1 Tax=Streptomyces sp. NPDC001941 TaxID=3154659 RepID=UPI00332DB68C